VSFLNGMVCFDLKGLKTTEVEAMSCDGRERRTRACAEAVPKVC
jgi:hypothetical protein